jgi:hypothetical protein
MATVNNNEDQKDQQEPPQYDLIEISPNGKHLVIYNSRGRKYFSVWNIDKDEESKYIVKNEKEIETEKKISYMCVSNNKTLACLYDRASITSKYDYYFIIMIVN